MLNSARDIAIIGHGLTPKGRGWGHNIDDCYSVIRMWNYHWQNENDYGTAYDWGFLEISGTEMARFNTHNVRTPRLGWIATELPSNRGRKKYNGSLPGQLKLFDSNPWEAACRRLGDIDNGRVTLTRGVRAALAAMELSEPGDRMILVGFDNVKAGIGLSIEEGFPKEYVNCAAGFPFRDYTGGTTQYRNHYFALEEPLLLYFAKKYHIELVHAQDVWK